MGIKQWLGRGRSDDPAPARILNHPSKLRPGDMIKFEFCAQNVISNESFTVHRIGTWDLGGETTKRAVYFSEDGPQHMRFAVITDQRQETLEVARLVLPEDILQVFDQQAFVHVLEPESGFHHALKRAHSEPDKLAGWTGQEYRQEIGLDSAYFYAEDYRNRAMPVHADVGTPCTFYYFVTDDRQHALEIQVYDGGRTDVFLIARLPLDKIEALWPAEQ